MPRQEWDYTSRLDEVLAAFDSFRFGWLDMPTLIRGSEEVLTYPMADRDPLPSWDFGRVTLLGDAAHPMLPSLGQGGCQAIEDALELAASLAGTDDVPAALERYSLRRARRTTAIVRRSQQMSRLAHLRNPVAVALRDALLRGAPSSALLRWLAPVIGQGRQLRT